MWLLTSTIADGKKHPFHTPNISQSIKSKASRCVEIASKRTGEQTKFNRRHRTAPLSTLQPGTEVVITNHDQPGTVVKEADGPRSFVIETPTKNIRRNREHLVPVESLPKPPTPKKLPELNISLRPRRTVKPSLKALENAATS